jgi:hypothetical protein
VTALIRRSLTLPILVALAVGITACSGGVSGTPTPTASPSSDSPSTSAGSPLASLDPCSLLTGDEMTQLGVISNGPDNTPKSRGCVWQKHGAYTVGIYLDGTQGIDAPGSDGATKATLSSHDAVQVERTGCDIEIAISNTSSVDVNASYGGNQGQECQLAQTYAQMIESKLPAQQK